jgi:hypothetical protein
VLSFLGTRMPSSDSLWLTDVAHHHLAFGLPSFTWPSHSGRRDPEGCFPDKLRIARGMGRHLPSTGRAQELPRAVGEELCYEEWLRQEPLNLPRSIHLRSRVDHWSLLIIGHS